jgi:hypothetical protein
MVYDPLLSGELLYGFENRAYDSVKPRRLSIPLNVIAKIEYDESLTNDDPNWAVVGLVAIAVIVGIWIANSGWVANSTHP